MKDAELTKALEDQKQEVKKYDITFKDKAYRSLEASMGLRHMAFIQSRLKFKRVLDVGCGPGWSVIEFLKRGYDARGIEPCQHLHDNELRMLVGLGIVKQATANAIPLPADLFDLVYCTDVMEHIVESLIDKCIEEFIRVSNKYIFCTISFTKARCHPELNLHITVHNREWWKAKFEKYRLKDITKQDDPKNIFMYRKF